MNSEQKVTRIGLLGFGKIGKALAEEVIAASNAELVFIQDPFAPETDLAPMVRESDPSWYEKVDLMLECATADVLKQEIGAILPCCNLMMFSVTAFSDAEFEQQALSLCVQHGTHIYLPHGAILGLDGIFDGRSIINSVTIETTKNPASLSRTDTERTVLYEGPTRKACQLFPRNVNVHAAVALAGIGFERTTSRIVADPAVHTNTHIITVEGEGIRFQLDISSFASSGVTGAYTPISARGSLRRLLGGDGAYSFV